MTQILLKRSSVAAKVPATTDLASGELALNIVDGKVFMKTTVASVDAILEIGAVKSVAGRTGAVVLAKGDVGLGNVDNTADVNKPVSTPQQNAINAKMANPMTTAGDLIVGGASGAPARLAIGTAGQVLTVSGGAEVWATPASAPVTSVFGRTGAVVLTQADVDALPPTSLDGGAY